MLPILPLEKTAGLFKQQEWMLRKTRPSQMGGPQEQPKRGAMGIHSPAPRVREGREFVCTTEPQTPGEVASGRAVFLPNTREGHTL